MDILFDNCYSLPPSTAMTTTIMKRYNNTHYYRRHRHHHNNKNGKQRYYDYYRPLLSLKAAATMIIMLLLTTSTTSGFFPANFVVMSYQSPSLITRSSQLLSSSTSKVVISQPYCRFCSIGDNNINNNNQQRRTRRRSHVSSLIQRQLNGISLCLSARRRDDDEEIDDDYPSSPSSKETNNRTITSEPPSSQPSSDDDITAGGMQSPPMKDLTKRVLQLEHLVSKQNVEIQRLRQECRDLSDAAATFAQVVELLRQAGLSADGFDDDDDDDEEEEDEDEDDRNVALAAGESSSSSKEPTRETKYEYFDGSEIFGTAPSSVIDAADAAGAAILSALLGGKRRMLVDVRDAELSRDNDILVQFIELAILPVAAGLEGLDSQRNRVKIVFPTVSALLQYRKSMALAAPDVVALSTLGFDAVEERDNLVVVLVPRPDDEDGMRRMWQLLDSKKMTDDTNNGRKGLEQPVVLLNYHMVPVSADEIRNFEVAYHLRLLSVQYMSGDMNPEYVKQLVGQQQQQQQQQPSSNDNDDKDEDSTTISTTPSDEEDAALEAAMEHAHNKTGLHQGVTRAMVIRAYPRPWHVFVDTSPDPDSDFEVAATFDEEPSSDDVNYAIVECLEGSEREDELVAQQMQEALEAGQLSQVSEMLGMIPGGAGGEDDYYARLHNITDDWDEEEEGGMTEDSC